MAVRNFVQDSINNIDCAINLGPWSCGSGTSCSTPAIAGLVCLVLHDIRRRCEDEESKASDTVIASRPLTHYVRSVWVMRELLKVMSCSPGRHSEEIGYGTINPIDYWTLVLRK